MLEKLLELFTEFYIEKGIENISGREIIERLELANHQYIHAGSYNDNTSEISMFFEEFCYDILTINPGEDEMSSIWIENYYGLNTEYKREIKLRSLLDK